MWQKIIIYILGGFGMKNIKFVKIYNFILIDAGKTQNEFTITEDMIEEAIVEKLFDYTPIIYNKNGKFTNYTNDDITCDYVCSNVVGFVLPGTAEKRIASDGHYYVQADVLILDKFSDKGKYDNWMIDYNKDIYPYLINYCSCEIF